MTLADHTDPRFTAGQLETVAVFENAPTPPEVDAATVEKVARALWEEDGGDVRWATIALGSYLRSHYRRLAVAAIDALPVSPAEAAVRRVEAVLDALIQTADETEREGYRPIVDARVVGARLHAALAPQAGE